jgi:hypothetical protein
VWELHQPTLEGSGGRAVAGTDAPEEHEDLGSDVCLDADTTEKVQVVASGVHPGPPERLLFATCLEPASPGTRSHRRRRPGLSRGLLSRRLREDLPASGEWQARCE